MPCTRPIQAGFDSEGQITFSQKTWSKEFEPFQLPCRKCIFCRLEQAREKAIRCIHHAQLTGDRNIFLTTTYDEEHLESPWLIYSHWQSFMKSLRESVGYHPDDRISVMVTGEYGDLGKRPHWHAILFNYRPSDEKFDRQTEAGHRVFTSEELSELWGRGRVEYGDVTLESAGYVARYAAKKLVHGKDHEHNYRPIHRTSSKNAIGKPWIEKYWKQTFENGFVVLPGGTIAGIPRFYEDWFRKTMPNAWLKYASTVKVEQRKLAQKRAQKEEEHHQKSNPNPTPWTYPLSRPRVKEVIQEQKHKDVLKGLKL